MLYDHVIFVFYGVYIHFFLFSFFFLTTVLTLYDIVYYIYEGFVLNLVCFSFRNTFEHEINEYLLFGYKMF